MNRDEKFISLKPLIPSSKLVSFNIPNRPSHNKKNTVASVEFFSLIVGKNWLHLEIFLSFFTPILSLKMVPLDAAQTQKSLQWRPRFVNKATFQHYNSQPQEYEIPY